VIGSGHGFIVEMIKMRIKEMLYEEMGWIQVSHDRGK
jgi:hypothetical protein